MKTICDYHNCAEPICDDDKEFSDKSLKFCQEHHDLVCELIESNNIAGLMKFWVSSYGGPELMGQSTHIQNETLD